MRQTHIQAIGTAVPRYLALQTDVAQWAKKVAVSIAEGDGEAAGSGSRTGPGVIDRIYRQSAIAYRHSVVPDYVCDPSEFEFYPKNWELDPSPSTAARMEIYRREAPVLARQAVERCLAKVPNVSRDRITHLVVVSCTGFFAPGLDILLAKHLSLRPDVKRSIIGFMGCYAAFNALRLADSVCRADDGAVVLVVCVELCSIHFQRELTMNNVVANCIFSDGAAAVLLTSEGDGSTNGQLAIKDSHSLVADDSESQMTWTVTDTGFQMALAAEVPATLKRCIEPFVCDLLHRNHLDPDRVAFWAIHPGGRRIVEAVQEQLRLPDTATTASFAVLSDHGNMSSPTVLFVLERILDDGVPCGGDGVALAFGPGLTLESMLFRAL